MSTASKWIISMISNPFMAMGDHIKRVYFRFFNDLNPFVDMDDDKKGFTLDLSIILNAFMECGERFLGDICDGLFDDLT
jgi:hypothetical protein